MPSIHVLEIKSKVLLNELFKVKFEDSLKSFPRLKPAADLLFFFKIDSFCLKAISAARTIWV